MNKPPRTYEWVTSHIWLSHVAHKNVSCHKWMSHVTRMTNLPQLRVRTGPGFRVSVLYINQSRRTCEWVVLHIFMIMSHVWEKLRRVYEWVMSHIWMSHVTQMNESHHTYEWVMSHIWMCHVTRTRKIPLRIRMSHATHMNVTHVSRIGMWMWDSYVWRTYEYHTHIHMSCHTSCHTYHTCIPCGVYAHVCVWVLRWVRVGIWMKTHMSESLDDNT